MNAKEFIKSKHNGEIPYQYGANECAKLMESYAKQLIESVSDEEIEKKYRAHLRPFIDNTSKLMREKYSVKAAKWLKQKLLKNNEQ